MLAMMLATATSAFLVQAQAGAAVPPLKITPLGKPEAKVGGTFTWSLGAEPQSINPLSIQELVSQWIADYVMEGLLYQNPETYQFEPQLAESYDISKDGLTFTFYLRKGAKFSDGSPVTAEDVKFSIDLVKDPAYKATARLPYYQDVESVTAVDPTTVKIKMKRKYYKNLEVLGSGGFTPIVSKKIYGDPKKKFSDNSMFGSGAYKVEAYNRGKNIILVRNPEWWGNQSKDFKGLAKFERIQLRFIKDQNLEIEMMRKGQQDFMWEVRAENYEKKAVGEPFGTSVLKFQVENSRPKNYSFIGWNNRSPLFKDRNVRMALAHLLNRKLLIEKFLFEKSAEAAGPYYYGSPFTPSDMKPVGFNPEKAKELLKKAGWTDKEKKGVLQKDIDGKPTEFRFTLLLPNREVEKYFTIYKEDLKKAGIEMEIKLLEWSAFEKLLNEQKFDAVTLSWGGGSVEDDLKQIWHSDSSKPGGSNFVGYSNPKVDKLIDQARGEMNEAKRKVMWQKAAHLIADDAPYAFMFSPKYDLFLLNKKIGYDKPTYKYDKSYPYFYSATL
jgi:peptide/nickel transport system substrate-binding protein/microcin C transport system substrate-binding protein